MNVILVAVEMKNLFRGSEIYSLHKGVVALTLTVS